MTSAVSKNDASKAPKNAMHYPEHEKTYELFLTVFKWGTIFCIAILIFMAIVLL